MATGPTTRVTSDRRDAERWFAGGAGDRSHGRLANPAPAAEAFDVHVRFSRERPRYHARAGRRPPAAPLASRFPFH
jgi:hypothetical protein